MQTQADIQGDTWTERYMRKSKDIQSRQTDQIKYISVTEVKFLENKPYQRHIKI